MEQDQNGSDDEAVYSSEPINIDPEIFSCPSKLIAFMKEKCVSSVPILRPPSRALHIVGIIC